MKMLIFVCVAATITTAHADALVDPMRPASVQEKAHVSTGALKVSAIFRSGKRRIAIIDGKAVGEGDSIGNAIIDSIGIDEVQYTRAGRREAARLATETLQVRTPAPQ